MKVPLSINKKTIAGIISALTHPIFVPSVASLLIFNSNEFFGNVTFNAKLQIFYLTLGITCLFPLVFLILFYGLSELSKFKASQKNERIFPLVLIALSYYFAYRYFGTNHILFVLTNFLLSLTIGILIALFINFIWKISLHMIGIGGMVSLLLFMEERFFSSVFFPLVAVIIIGGIAASMRLYLQEHNPLQLLAGLLLGFMSVNTMYFLI